MQCVYAINHTESFDKVIEAGAEREHYFARRNLSNLSKQERTWAGSDQQSTAQVSTAQVLRVNFPGNCGIVRSGNNCSRIFKDRDRDVVSEKAKHELIKFYFAQFLKSTRKLIKIDLLRLAKAQLYGVATAKYRRLAALFAGQPRKVLLFASWTVDLVSQLAQVDRTHLVFPERKHLQLVADRFKLLCQNFDRFKRLNGGNHVNDRR